MLVFVNFDGHDDRPGTCVTDVTRGLQSRDATARGLATTLYKYDPLAQGAFISETVIG